MPHAIHMSAAFAAARLQRVAQDGHHSIAVAFLPQKALGHYVHQPVLFGVQQDGIDDAPADDAGGEGTTDVIRGPQRKGVVNGGGAGFGRDHYDRDFLQPAMGAHFFQHRKTIHFWHDDIQKQRGDLPVIDLQSGNGLPPIGCLDDLVILIQYIGKDRSVHFGIIGDQ